MGQRAVHGNAMFSPRVVTLHQGCHMHVAWSPATEGEAAKTVVGSGKIRW